MNLQITPQQIETLEKEFNVSIITDDIDIYNGWYISDWDNYLNGMTIKLPKKKAINKDWLISKIIAVKNKQKTEFVNLQPLFEKLNLKGDIYYTSYGFGYSALFKGSKRFNEDVDKLKLALQEIGTNYKCEFSDGHWVYRFKISKKQENLKIIENYNKI